MKNQKKGFTLIELLVVIAIIGILSAIGLVALNGAREKARDAQRQSDLSQYRTALALWYDDNNSTYPEIIAGTGGVDSISSTGVLNDVNNMFGSTANGVVSSATSSRYLGAALLPPGGGTGDQLLYKYDANTDAVGPIAFVLYTKLEGGATNYYRMYNTGQACSNNTTVPSCTASPCITGC